MREGWKLAANLVRMHVVGGAEGSIICHLISCLSHSRRVSFEASLLINTADTVYDSRDTFSQSPRSAGLISPRFNMVSTAGPESLIISVLCILKPALDVESFTYSKRKPPGTCKSQ